jgi:uncharacterized membrane-anchored protein
MNGFFTLFRTLSIIILVLLIGSITGVSRAMAQEEATGPVWEYGPTTAKLGNIAEIDIPDGYQFVGGAGTRDLLEYLENPTNGHELGLVMPIPRDDSTPFWFVVFEYSPLGYVRDDEKDDLDADAILKSISEGTEASNDIRRKNGWAEFHVRGWETSPYYDEQSNNLKWAIIGYSSGEDESINFSTRLLGRGGAMSADLVMGRDGYDQILADYESLLVGYRFSSGNKYAEFRQGDKVAKYGLTALVAGGVGAVAMKTGLLARFWKVIVFGFLAVVGSVRKVFSRLFSGKKSNDDLS